MKNVITTREQIRGCHRISRQERRVHHINLSIIINKQTKNRFYFFSFKENPIRPFLSCFFFYLYVDYTLLRRRECGYVQSITLVAARKSRRTPDKEEKRPKKKKNIEIKNYFTKEKEKTSVDSAQMCPPLSLKIPKIKK